MKKVLSLVPGFATTEDERPDRVCHCGLCERDGQHALTCSVHRGPFEGCDCERRVRESVRRSG
jgi:hypothetical protein